MTRLEENAAADDVRLTADQLATSDALTPAAGDHHNEAQMRLLGARPPEPDTEHALASTPTEELPALSADAVPNSGAAYAISEQAGHLRVQSADITWGERGHRVDCLSSVIFTPLARDEMSGPGGEGYRTMIATSAAGRVGTSDEVASAAASLLGPEPASSPTPTCSSMAASSPPCAPARGPSAPDQHAADSGAALPARAAVVEPSRHRRPPDRTGPPSWRPVSH